MNIQTEQKLAVKPPEVTGGNALHTASPARTKKRHTLLILSFIICVILPAALGFGYLYLIAKDQYGSSLAFSVRSEEFKSPLDVLGGLGQLSTSSSADSDILYEYMQSQRLVEIIDKNINLRALYSKAEGDPVFGYDTTGSIEDLLDYWGRMVNISYDSGTHLTNIIIAGLPMVYAIGLIREITLSQRVELTEMASRDPLTKLYNRRFAKKLILATYKKSIETDQSLCLVMADIDHFKQINDTYGHDKGDAILVNIAQAIGEFLNETDIAVRWGGEEFLLLLDNTDEYHGLQKIEALREHIATLDAHQELPNLSVTMSFGLIEWQPLASLERMLQQADAALYDSKDAGRNTTTVVKAFCLQLDDTDAVN